MKSYKTTPPSFKTVLQHPWLWISTFFGSGCITPAPGTWGSFAAWGVFWLLDMWLGRSFIWALALVLFVLGCVSVGKSTAYLNKVDHGSIVVDEVVAVWVILLLTPLGFWWQLSSVIAFRFLTSLSFRPHRCWIGAVRTALLSCLTIYLRLFTPSWLLIRWPGWQGSTEPLHLCGFCDE